MVKEAPAFWVTSMCNRNISLADLNVTIPAFRSVNLLDKRHYSYTLEQLQKSKENGSLFHKRNIVSVRQVAPALIKNDIPFLPESSFPSRERSVLVIKEEHYEELDLSDKDQKKKDEELMKEFMEDNDEFAGTNDTKTTIKG
jgi:hypothetical protein